MANKQGDFIWYELMTDDAPAAQAFYGALLGWSFEHASDSELDYRQFSMNGVPVGGILPLAPGMVQGGAGPCWLGYINVEDVDRMAAAIKAADGSVHMEPQDIAGIGRFAVVADPTGAVFYIMTPIPPPGGGFSRSFAATEPMPGHCAWNELASSDPAVARTFYHDLFGWVKDGEMDMGELGKYEFLRHDFILGALMPKMPEMPGSMWTYYFRAPDIDAAEATIKAQGGTVIQQPTEIPGGEYSMVALDPQGAVVGLVGARK